MPRSFLLAAAILWQIFPASSIQSVPFPIQLSISETKIVEKIPIKDQDFAFLHPQDRSTYIYTEETDYYKDYQRSYFAVTCKKGGWDCMRHYEILANGCIPYFLDLGQCNPKTLSLFPKKLILEAMNLEGVSYPRIDHKKFDKKKYYEILHQLLAYTKEHLSSKKIAESIVSKLGYSGRGKILYLSGDLAPDYLRCASLIGLKELLREKIIDVPKIEHIYKNYPGDIQTLYGLGFSYTRIIEDIPIDRGRIEERIQNREFELIIYGSIHRGLPFFDLVQNYYNVEEIAYFCGEDHPYCPYIYAHNLFLREYQ